MDESDSVMTAISRMMECQSGAVLITDDGTQLRGIFTERDVMSKIVATGRDPKTTSLGDVMTREVIKLNERTSLDHAITIMGKNRILHLPVENSSGNLIGMVSLRYLLHDKIRDLVDELNSLEAYHGNDALGG